MCHLKTMLRSKAHFLLVGGLLLALLVAGSTALARPGDRAIETDAPIHPVFPLLDAEGQNVLGTGAPVSSMRTCGECHDTEFIAAHSEHSGLGSDPLPSPVEDLLSSPAVIEEMNCFLCHVPGGNNAARLQAVVAGAQEWQTAATLLGSGIVEQDGTGYRYLTSAFDEEGSLQPEFVTIQEPSSAACGACHATVHTDPGEFLTLPDLSSENWRAGLTGMVFSSQELSASGVNLAGKEDLNRAWDAHAERALKCTDCHYSLNNPVFFQEDADTLPDHLTFDPRRLEIGEYLQMPSHLFAQGSDPEGLGGEAQNSMRRCESCHSIEKTHGFLPYKQRHVQAISCESCHIPKVFAPALQEVDWTVLYPDGSPRLVSRGLSTRGELQSQVVTGYEPVLLPRVGVEGETKIAPFNLITTWNWVAGQPAQPVTLEALKTAWLDEDGYTAQVQDTFDSNADGILDDAELALDSDAKLAIITARLEAQGLEDPRIEGQVRPFSLNHSVATGEWSIESCSTCHSEDSRLVQPVKLSNASPGGGTPTFVENPGAMVTGKIFSGSDGALYYQPQVNENSLYVLGYSAVGWIDLFGSLAFAGVLLGVFGHGTLRFITALRKPRGEVQVEKVYMYSVYERFWHWLQTATILGLLFTGLIIHKPDTFGLFTFRGVVLVHNVLAVLLLANAGLSLFYHLASGQIQQYIPRPAGFFDQMVVQALYYLRGIFQGDSHPFEKTPDKKLNPLQQVTYFAILNVLLPLQVITGALMWGVTRWPDLAGRVGGLPFLAPFHSLIAWLFAAFIVGHVYLTTTGHTPLASIQAMMMGWDEVVAQPELAVAAVPVEEAGD